MRNNTSIKGGIIYTYRGHEFYFCKAQIIIRINRIRMSSRSKYSANCGACNMTNTTVFHHHVLVPSMSLMSKLPVLRGTGGTANVDVNGSKYI